MVVFVAQRSEFVEVEDVAQEVEGCLNDGWKYHSGKGGFQAGNQIPQGEVREIVC